MKHQIVTINRGDAFPVAASSKLPLGISRSVQEKLAECGFTAVREKRAGDIRSFIYVTVAPGETLRFTLGGEVSDFCRGVLFARKGNS